MIEMQDIRHLVLRCDEILLVRRPALETTSEREDRTLPLLNRGEEVLLEKRI